MAPTLAEIAEQLEADARKLQEEGNHEAAAKLALAACAAWKAHESLLTAGKYSPKIAAMAMPAEHREAISMGRAGRKAGPLLKAAQSKGYKTMKELAAALGVSTSFLSQVVNGGKKMPPDMAEWLRDKIGWES